MTHEQLLFEELRIIREYQRFHSTMLHDILRKLGETMSDVTNLSNEIAGLVSDQAAFNTKVDADLAAIAAFIAALIAQGSAPTQEQLDSLQSSVASVRANLQAEGAKVDAAVPSTSATPAA